jgi:single-stranded-DNA-specific exonuclease
VALGATCMAEAGVKGRGGCLYGPPSAYHLGFLLGPRINAGGRVGDAGLGVRLLTSESPEEAERLAFRLDRLNEERQAIEAAALEEAEAMVARLAVTGELPPALVVGAAGWHPGVVGLVAARLKERYRRPAFAIAGGGRGDDRHAPATGSGRSIAGVDIGRAVRAALAEGLLTKGGGHPMAAGLSLDPARRGELESFFIEALAAEVAAARAADALKIVGVVMAGGAGEALVEMIERAGPYGAGHPEPVFAVPAHAGAYCGATAGGHLRLTLKAPSGERLKAMAFRADGAPLGAAIAAARDAPHHFAGSLMLDRYRGVPTVKLRVIDAAPVSAAAAGRWRSAA